MGAVGGKSTEHGSAHAGRRADPVSAYWAAESLRWVLLAALLTELGISDVPSRIAQDREYQVCQEQVQAAMPPRPSDQANRQQLGIGVQRAGGDNSAMPRSKLRRVLRIPTFSRIKTFAGPWRSRTTS